MSAQAYARVQATPKQSDASVRPSFSRARAFRQSSSDIADPAGHDRPYTTGHPHLTPSALDHPRVGHSFGRISVNSPVPPMIQAKLMIGQPGDKCEQEADRVAEQVMRMPEPKVRTGESMVGRSQLGTIQRACSKRDEEVRTQPVEEEEKDEKLRRQVEEEDEEESLEKKPLAVQMSPLIQRQGEPPEEEEERMVQDTSPASQITPNPRRNLGNLDRDTKSYMETRFGVGFDCVRVHADRRAAKVALALSARAFTIGPNIYFGHGEYQPYSFSGRQLLAHELAHTVQQGFATPTVRRQKRGASYDLLGQTRSIPTGSDISSLEDDTNRRIQVAIRILEKALTEASTVLAENRFSGEELARIRIQAEKLRPMLEAYRRFERGEPPGDLVLDFDPYRDQIDVGDADLLQGGILDNLGPLATMAAPGIFVQRKERSLVSSHVTAVHVQRVVCGGLCIGAAVALGALLLAGCNRRSSTRSVGASYSRGQMLAVNPRNTEGWIRGRRTSRADGPVISLPDYLKVEYQARRDGRDYFEIKEGPYNGQTASILPGYLDSDRSWGGPVSVTFREDPDRSTALQSNGTLYYGEGDVPAKIYVSSGIAKISPNRNYKLRLPDAPHAGGANYGDFAKTWFLIEGGPQGTEYLHRGRFSAGCVTVLGEWRPVYRHLINKRSGNQHIGAIIRRIGSSTRTTP